ncbi:hypothetical protein LCER1_G000241 [Lachnellula cervina]|uniref:2EXR domain-containing protein n=1 Tax=Lachnellula cervina TaxID=1316786 RepID=A0A7D8YS34_9HELO|nr:hypothetical protein LCER1_G000241 [Lachnellula cervina]
MESIQPTDFTLFPHLPSELRLKIWEEMLPGPRDVEIEYHMDYVMFNEKKISKFTGWRSREPVPVGLHICQESRHEALVHYQPSFGSYFHPSKIYFNFSRDTLLFGASLPGSTYLLDVFLGGGFHGADDVEKLLSMVLYINEDSYGRRYFIWNEIRLFTSLQELKIMVWEADLSSDEIMRQYRSTLRDVKIAHPEWRSPSISIISAETGTAWGNLEPLEEPQ